MNKKKLNEILKSLNLDEKIGQCVQLGGEFFQDDLKTVQTGPQSKLGLRDDFDRYTIGSVINVLDTNSIKNIQKDYMTNSRHKIPLLFMADIIHGYKTIFPIPLAQAASFDFKLIEEAAAIAAKEAYYGGQHVTFSPMIDLSRDGRWGRISESPGEDPYVTAQFARAAVRGFQGDSADIPKEKIAATAKHYVGYGAVEAGREYNNVEMSMSTLRQFHLASFKAAVNANVRLVMTAFHTLNNVPATGSKLLNHDILRDELGFEGVLISDHSAVKELVVHGYAKDDLEAAEIGLKATVDIDMKTAVYANEIKTLIETNRISESLLDEAVMRVLELKMDLGLFENPYRGFESTFPSEKLEEHEAVALKLAEESVVLLKNNGVLPLTKEKSVALIGPNVDNTLMLGLWALTGDSKKYETLEDAFKRVATTGEIHASPGTSLFENFEQYGFPPKYGAIFGSRGEGIKDDQTLLDEALNIARSAEVIVMAIGENMLDTGEGGSKVNLEIGPAQVRLIRELKKLNKPMVAIVNSGRANILTPIVDDFDAILYGWYGGIKASAAVTNIIYGNTMPSGKLPVSMARHVGQLPLYYNNYASGRPAISGGPKERFTSRYVDVDNTPLFAFGHGLSYTTFSYQRLNVEHDKKKITVSFELSNDGQSEATEVAQLYIRVPYSKTVRPILELKGTKRVVVGGMSSQKVIFELSYDDLKFYDNDGQLVLDGDSVIIYVGGSSDNLPLQTTLRL